uniref:Uncharacterized protein n=1 Tax=Kalanchoe fedtschenkoi TaxID=63787 RepID=A0A7N0TG98_KALFE
MEEVVSVFPDIVYQPLTTRSWDFIGFPENVTRNHAVESDVIIAIIDTGIASDSPSFSDEGFGPIPKKWKGVSSIAAGDAVKGVSFYGLAEGTARGGVPSARIAAYKVCTAQFGCSGADILAAIDDAIADGVDIISVSLGSSESSFGYNPLVIGSFHAMEKGILTVQAGGNDGAAYGSVSSLVPWLLSVGASTTDRQFIDKAVLGDGTSLTGKSINSFSPIRDARLALIYGVGNKSANCDIGSIRGCNSGCLDPKTAKGNIVLCDGAQPQWDEVDRVGGVGAIVPIQPDSTDVADVSPLPGLSLSPQDFELVKTYVNSTRRPQATLLKSVAVKNPTAPSVAIFSSRGPNRDLPDINKPDLVAPGVEILAGYSPIVSLTNHYFDNRSSKYNILSGTSMACPHVAGAAAYVKTFHPDWSPSAIKSALMTSARPMNGSGKEFAYGSGQIDPVKAVDPGLIYDLTHADYLNYICTAYGNTTLKNLLPNATCPDKQSPPTTFNYPSLTYPINLNETKAINVVFNRAVTNVGLPNSTYTAKVVSDPRLKIEVAPETLSFKSLNETLAFTVKVTGEYPGEESILSSSLVWSDGTHVVRSPIVVYKLLREPVRPEPTPPSPPASPPQD